MLCAPCLRPHPYWSTACEREMHVKAGFTRIQDMSMTPFAPKAPSTKIGLGVRQLNARIIVTCELVQSATHCATRRLVEA
jgi:hypothetical protein